MWLIAACAETALPPCAAPFEEEVPGGKYCELPGSEAEEAGDSGVAAPTWTTLPTSCRARDDLRSDPLVEVDNISAATLDQLWEFVDIEIADGIAYAVGQGGLAIIDATPGGAEFLSHELSGRYHRVEPIGNGAVAVSHRNTGLYVWDVSDPSSPVPIYALPGSGMEGLSHAEGRLYVTVRDEGVVVFDTSDPRALSEVGGATGLEAPWELSKVVDGWLYAADATLGVVPIQAGDDPEVGEALALSGAVQHVTVADGFGYAAAGGAGVAILDLEDPATPVHIATVETGGNTLMSAVDDGLLYVVDHEGLSVFDVSDPYAPTPVGRQQTPEFALGVAADAGHGWVADWQRVESWRPDREAFAPEAELDRDDLRMDGQSTETVLTNRGGGDLHLTGATLSDDRLVLEVSASTVAPGASAIVRIRREDDAPIDATVCLESDDPDGPLLELTIRSGTDERWIGQPAPDFLLPDTNGEVHRLSEQLGHPVVLAYFATW